jgi:glycosyltransferase involved in cell wall biosynthesis
MVTSSYPTVPGDATAPFIQAIAEGVVEKGHGVDLVLPEHPLLSPGERGGVRLLPYRYAPAPGWTLWGYAQSLEADVAVRREVYLLAPLVALALRRAVAAALESRPYDVVHVHWVVPNAAFVVGIPRAHRVPLVVSLHGSDVFLSERSRLAGAFARRALAEARVVTACSSDLGRRAVALGASPGRVRVVPYGVDPQAFSPGKGAGVRGELGIPGGDLLVLAVGRLVEKKGFRYLLEAAAGLGGLALVLAGDGDLRDDLGRLAERNGVQVRFVGRLSRERVAELVGAADVVAVPSVVDQAGNVDGLPNALLEAMAAGKAVVGSRVAGIPDVVVDGTSGVLVPPGDVAALRGALVRLAGDPPLRLRLGTAARDRMREDFSWAKVAGEFVSSYAEAAALDAR